MVRVNFRVVVPSLWEFLLFDDNNGFVAECGVDSPFVFTAPLVCVVIILFALPATPPFCASLSSNNPSPAAV